MIIATVSFSLNNVTGNIGDIINKMNRNLIPAQPKLCATTLFSLWSNYHEQ
ncbi:hypothetical protein M998_2533 [Providencia heimbachae ATCC 35613]|uniref:Uncharacterized protein n=1 Tax=Providencia heimbachae ATCC 35613 TaxID=1354272 RepID=A0A1B7JR26_9GAMM|nr:hypothetical protein M998_2533 [Providencia heimbachae ATCC 35613]